MVHMHLEGSYPWPSCFVNWDHKHSSESMVTIEHGKQILHVELRKALLLHALCCPVVLAEINPYDLVHCQQIGEMDNGCTIIWYIDKTSKISPVLAKDSGPW